MKRRNFIREPAGGRSGQPIVSSYDSGYEHSLEHHIEVRRMVDNSEPGNISFTQEESAKGQKSRKSLSRAS